MSKVIYIAHRKEASFREVHLSSVRTNEYDSGECPPKTSERNPRSRSEHTAVPTLQGWSTLSSDLRFLDDARRAYTAAPDSNRSTQKTHARILAISILALACLGTVSEIVQSGSIDLLSTTTLGSATLVLLSGFCWRFGNSDPSTQIPSARRPDSSNEEAVGGR